MGDYIIKNITAKNGKELTELHNSAMGAECLIADLEKGERSLLRVKVDYDPDRFHRLHTSMVLDYTVSEDGNEVTIETFTGINSYTYDVAKDAVVKFLEKQDDDFFAKYRAEKATVLEDDDLISKCATLHHRLIKDAGLDYAWACDFACAHALSEALAYVPVY